MNTVSDLVKAKEDKEFTVQRHRSRYTIPASSGPRKLRLIDRHKMLGTWLSAMVQLLFAVTYGISSLRYPTR